MSRFCIIAIVALLAAQAALATDYSWSGTVTGANSIYTWNNTSATGWKNIADGSTGVYPYSFTDTAFIPTQGNTCTMQTDSLNSGITFPIPIQSITLGNADELTNRSAIKLGGYYGCSGFELPDGGSVVHHSKAGDTGNCQFKLDGAVTFEINSNPTSISYSEWTQNGVVSGAGGIVKTGIGGFTFNGGASTYTGLTWVKAGRITLGGTSGTTYIGAGGLKIDGGSGKVQMSNSNHIDDNCPVEFAGNDTTGGDLTFAGAGTWTETVGTLTMSGNGSISFAYQTTPDTLHFANSSAVTWGADKYLTIYTYGHADQFPSIWFGTDATGLTADQLAHVRYATQDGSGNNTQYFTVGIDSNGKLYLPEPATMGLLVAGGLAMLRRRRA